MAHSRHIKAALKAIHADSPSASYEEAPVDQRRYINDVIGVLKTCHDRLKGYSAGLLAYLEPATLSENRASQSTLIEIFDYLDSSKKTGTDTAVDLKDLLRCARKCLN